MLQELLSLLILATFILINAALLVGRLLGAITGMTWRKVLRLDLPENEKKGWERLYTLVWLPIGLWAFYKLWGWSLTRATAAVFGFFAFRSGANVARTLVYSLHDRKIIEEYAGESRTLGTIGRATRLSLLVEGLFVVSFALLYKTLSVTLNPGGRSASAFILYLWLAGLLFGLLFGWLIARNNRGILMRNAIATVGFFALRKGKEKVDGTTDAVKKAPEKLLSGMSKRRK